MAQLTQKTNQFNLTTMRYSETEIENWLSDDNGHTDKNSSLRWNKWPFFDKPLFAKYWNNEKRPSFKFLQSSSFQLLVEEGKEKDQIIKKTGNQDILGNTDDFK